ncbi:unnamed protein product [Closterium sp. NIES-53]
MASLTLFSGLPRSLPPLPPGPAPTCCVPCVEGRQRAALHSTEFPPTEASLQTLQMDIKGEVTEVLIDWIRGTRRRLSESFGSDLPVLRLHSDRGGEFSCDLLKAFCRAEGIRQTFTLPASPQQNGIAERRIGMYDAHQINLQPRVSLQETTPTLRWMEKVGYASVFLVWGSRAFVRDTSVDKLSSRAVPCVFLGFPPDAPGWQFYHPTSRRVLSSHHVMFDESVSYYRLFPYRTASLPPPPLFLAPDPVEPVEVAVDSGAARGDEPAGAGTGGVEPRVAVSEGAEPGGAEPERVEPGGAEPGCVESGSAEPGLLSLSMWSLGPLSPQQLCQWYALRCRCAARAGAAAGATRGASGAGAAGGAAGAGGARAAGLGGAGAGGTGAVGGPAGVGAVGGAGAAGPGGARTGGTGAVGPGGTAGVGAAGAGAVATGGLELELLERVPLQSPPASSLPDSPDLESDSFRAAHPTVMLLLGTSVIDPLFESTVASALVAELVDFAAACRLDYATSLVAESAAASVYPPSVGGECALRTNVLENRQEEFECFATAVPHLVSMLLAPEGDPDAPDIPTPRSYAEAIEGPYSSQWQETMDAEMASWKSTGTYVDEVPPPGANIISGMWMFRVKRPPSSPPIFKARYVARVFSQRQGVDFFHTFSPTPKMTTLRVLMHVAAQRDYELHSLAFSTAFLQGSLHEEIWLRRPPGFTRSTTLAALGFAPSSADPSLFLRTITTLRPFSVLVYVDDLVFATADTEALAHMKSELQKRHTCTDLGELASYLGLWITRDRAQRTITLTQSHMVQQVLQRFGFTYSSPQYTPLPTSHSLSAPPLDESYVGHGARVGGRARVVLTGHADASWVDDLATQRSSQDCTFSLGSGSISWWSTRSSFVLNSSCEAEINVGVMAAQELRWLTYLLTDLGEAPRSPPVLYVDNKAMIALC